MQAVQAVQAIHELPYIKADGRTADALASWLWDETATKGKWTWEEDNALRAAVADKGEAWAAVAQAVPGRTRKQCRDRWLVHTRSSNHSPLSLAEQVRLVDLHRAFGNQWKRIADNMYDRSEQHLKNLFNTRRKAKSAGHEPLLYAYLHGAPSHCLAGLDTPLVYAAVHDVRDAVNRHAWCVDVQLWQNVSYERGLHVSLLEVPWDLLDLQLVEDALCDGPRGMRAFQTAATTLGADPPRTLLLSSGLVGVVGIAHSDAQVCSDLAQLTSRLWQLDRHAGHLDAPADDPESTRKRRRMSW